jgi:hypothetical protein
MANEQPLEKHVTVESKGSMGVRDADARKLEDMGMCTLRT